jgi:hypothetical protein
VCGDRAAMFLMVYSRDQKVAYDPIVTQMVHSLKPEGLLIGWASNTCSGGDWLEFRIRR